MKFVHIADIHLGMGFATASFGAKKGKERRREIKETLMRVVDYCHENAVDLLLIAGDMFEEDYVSISELKDMNRAFGKLTKTKVLMSAGNHDPIMDNNSLYAIMDWCDQVYLFDTTMSSLYLEDLNTQVWSFSWDKKHLPPFALEGTLDIKGDAHQIMMLHGDVYQENDYLYIDKKLLPPMKMDYIALGHIHKTDFIEPWLAYPGSLEPLDFSETGDHGFIEGIIDDEGLKASFKAFAKRSFRRASVQISGDMTYEDIRQTTIASVQDLPNQDYIRLTLEGDIDPQVALDLDQLQEDLEEHCHYIELRDKTLLDLDLEQLEKDYQGTLVGSYIEALKGSSDAIGQEALKQGLRILLEEQVQL